MINIRHLLQIYSQDVLNGRNPDSMSEQINANYGQIWHRLYKLETSVIVDKIVSGIRQTVG